MSRSGPAADGRSGREARCDTGQAARRRVGREARYRPAPGLPSTRGPAPTRGPAGCCRPGPLSIASANVSRIIDWLKARLALRTLNRMNRTSAALFEPGLETLTVDEHDRRNPFNQLAQMEQLRLIA